MKTYRILEIHPDYKQYLEENGGELIGAEDIESVVGLEFTTTGLYVHDELSPPLSEDGSSLVGWIGVPPWEDAHFVESGADCCLIAVKVVEVE